MVLLDVVYLSMKRDKSYGNVTPKLMEGITLEIELLIRYCNNKRRKKASNEAQTTPPAA